ncbi:hypothetical protein ATE47_08455 [Chryseobacterium sp. IHB B 17019]|nr:hypothetical protein ATE47_08455 [Chryseobacterium sp. IHB B 17019]
MEAGSGKMEVKYFTLKLNILSLLIEIFQISVNLTLNYKKDKFVTLNNINLTSTTSNFQPN